MTNKVHDEVVEKFGEWLEMAGKQSPALMIDILCKMIEKERELTEYYKVRCENVKK
jgi:hypothetical protein